jgi:hypothetical protein
MTSMVIPDVVAGIENHLDEADRVLVLGPAEDALAAARAVGSPAA